MYYKVRDGWLLIPLGVGRAMKSTGRSETLKPAERCVYFNGWFASALLIDLSGGRLTL